MQLIAEVGLSHDGKPEKAEELVSSLINLEVPIIKFQMYTQKTFPHLPWLPKEDYRRLIRMCEKSDTQWFITCFDRDSMYFARNMGQQIWKIPSGLVKCNGYINEIVDMFKASSPDYRKLFVSGGTSSMKEINELMNDIMFSCYIPLGQMEYFYCTSEYPTSEYHMGLKNIQVFKSNPKRKRINVSLSDHSISTTAIIAAIIAQAYGCNYLEKHVSLTPWSTDEWHRGSIGLTNVKNIMSYLDLGEKILQKYGDRMTIKPDWLKDHEIEIRKSMQPVFDKFEPPMGHKHNGLQCNRAFDYIDDEGYAG